MPRKGHFGLGFLTHLPTKPQTPGTYSMSPPPRPQPCLHGSGRLSQAHSATWWSVLPGRSSFQARVGCTSVIGGFLATALMSISFDSVQGSFTSFSYIQLQGTKEEKEGNAQNKKKKRKEYRV